MKNFIPALFIFTLFSYITGFGQADTTSLVTEVKNKLDNHSTTVSAVLSNPAYEVLHPQTSFRAMIKMHSDDKVLVIVNDKEPGKRIKVIATVKNKDGQPVAGALVYLYQTDSRGWYAADAPHVLIYEGDFGHARIFGYGKTDKNGRLELHTIKPSGYPRSDLPAHIHVHISAKGYRPFGTEFLFDDDERLVGAIRSQSVQNGFIISKPAPAAAPFDQQFTFAMTLQQE